MLNSKGQPLRIAISGRSGCGNSTVCKILSRKLGLRLVNYTFHDIAHEKGMDFHDFCRMAEEDSQWDFFVDAKQVKLAMEGPSVLGSRLAIWMLKKADLKVFLTASPEVRAGRIHYREGGSLEQRMIETEARDYRDHQRYKKLYNINNDDYGFADLILNTNRLDQYQTAGVIEAAARELSKKEIELES